MPAPRPAAQARRNRVRGVAALAATLVLALAVTHPQPQTTLADGSTPVATAAGNGTAAPAASPASSSTAQAGGAASPTVVATGTAVATGTTVATNTALVTSTASAPASATAAPTTAATVAPTAPATATATATTQSATSTTPPTPASTPAATPASTAVPISTATVLPNPAKPSLSAVAVSPTVAPPAPATPASSPAATAAASAVPTAPATATVAAPAATTIATVPPAAASSAKAVSSNARSAATHAAVAAAPAQATNWGGNAQPASGYNSAITSQSNTQVGTNAVTAIVDPPSWNPPTINSNSNNRFVGQVNAQVAVNQAAVQIDGNGNTVIVVQKIEQVAQNIAAALFASPSGNSGNVQVNQSGFNLGQNTALITVNGDGQQRSLSQTLVQGSINSGTTQQPAAGSGQTAVILQQNVNAAFNSTGIVITGNNNTVTIVQTIIQIAQNLSTSLVPRDGQSAAVGSTLQFNFNLSQNAANTALVSGAGNSVVINQDITQVASNENQQLVPGSSIPAPSQSNQWQSPAQTASSMQPSALQAQAPTAAAPGAGGGAASAAQLTAPTNGNAAAGTVSFVFFPNGNCSGAGTPGALSGAVPFSAAGTYSYRATYSGDAANSPTSSGCVTVTVP